MTDTPRWYEALASSTWTGPKPAAIGVFVLLAAPFVAAPAQAQESLRDVLGFLVTNHSIETADFDRDQEAAAATRDTISRALAVALATLPLTSSSGGFAYAFNPALGTVDRASDSFGPFFIERALTAPRYDASVGLSWRFARFARLHGHDLRDEGLVTIANQFTDEPEPFDQESLTLNFRTSTLTAFGSYGVTDRLEMGAAVPFVQLQMDGRRVNTYRGRSVTQAEATAQTRGVGDVALRAKYRLFGGRSSGVAAAADLRLPTGRDADLLGAGRAALTLLGIASVDTGETAVHFNAGLTRGGASDELQIGGAVATAAAPHVTVSIELLGRYIDSLHDIAAVRRPHPRVAGVETMRLLPTGEGSRTLLAVGGAKWNVGGAWLLTGNLLWSLTDTGLTAPLMPSLALDYSF